MSRPAGVPALEARERLLRAAETLFAQKGYAATAVHELTDAAGVNRALLYYYFEDKHSLYTAVIDEATGAFERMLDEALASPGSYSERLAAIVRGHLELIWTRGDLPRLVHRCLLDGYQEEFGLVQKFNRSVERLEAFFRDAVAAGEFRAVDPAITARSFLGPTFVFSLWRISEGDRFSRDAIAAEVTAQLLRGLETG
jgi:AcrR family transcriptional regulator